ncbi:MAG: hypothetical protein HQL09_05935 [Nitrospirae bacterium]|nr:hypothetical protein [Nitrospirota bacterium]
MTIGFKSVDLRRGFWYSETHTVTSYEKFMKKIYSNNAERQKAFRERRKKVGFQTTTLMVPDYIHAEIKGEPVKLLEAYIEYNKLSLLFNELSHNYEELKKNYSDVGDAEDYNKLQTALHALQADYENLKKEHELSKSEYVKLQDAYAKLKFGDWYSRK